MIWTGSDLQWPNYSVDDEQLIFDAKNTSGDDVVGRVDLQNDKINVVDNTGVVFIEDATRGVWFANGEREFTSVDDEIDGLSFELIGNPVDDELHFIISLDRRLSANVSIVDATGKIIDSKELDIEQGSTEFKMDVANLVSGSYYVHLISKEGIASRSFIK